MLMSWVRFKGSLAVRVLMAVGLFATALPLAGAELEKASNRLIELSSGWEFRQADDSKEMPEAAWLPAQVPGDVHLDLLRNKRIPDPYYRDNEAKLQWVQDASWEYRTKLVADADLLQHRRIEIVFAGLDTVAEVSLNGKKILSANNMFREWRADVKPLLQPGDNLLLVVFPSATKAAAAAAASDKWRAETLTPAKEYARKAAYEYGWDWGPTFVTSGIWRSVTLQAWDEERISNVYIQQLDISAEVAHLSAQIELNAAVDGHAEVNLRMEAPDGTHVDFTRSVAVQQGLNHIAFPIDIDKPSLWFPAGYGAHPIYHFHAKVSDEGRLQDEAAAQTGLRSVVLRRDPDQWGRTFEFVVNGIPVFAKGAALIPFDSFPNRVTENEYRRILQSAVDANMNMLRSWGGGYYETDQFFDICDDLGIMIWQDFMFGNEWQPGTYAFKQNVEQEVEYQVKRLRNHPSIALWCGNNETEVSWNWDRMKVPLEHAGSEGRRRMWQDYLTVFSGIIPQAVERLDPATPYWPSSPSADYEDVSETYQSGDMHDWAVWHGRAPFTEYETQYPRFMSEYGFQSFPEMKTIDAFTLPADRASIFTPVMLAHQKNDEGNAIIHQYMLASYGEPKDFPAYLYASQVLQAEGVKVGAEHLRRSRPRSMGSLYWQLNDCWPVASWSSIDYYGRWKALQYYARRFYSPILVSPHIEDGSLAVYVVSDKMQPEDLTLDVEIMNFDGKSIEEKVQDIHVDPLASKIYLKTPMEEIQGLWQLDKLFVATKLTQNGHEISSNILYFVPTAHIVLPQAKITHEVESTSDGFRVKLTSPVLARSVYLDFGELDAEVSDNYFDLLPGVPVEITLHTEATLDQLRAALTIRTLADTFSSKALAASSITEVPANPDWR